MHENIKSGKYEHNLWENYTLICKTPAERVDYKRNVIWPEDARLKAMFKQDLLNYLNITDHPKADKLFNLAWELGHGFGYNEVLQYAEDLVELLQ